MLILGDGKVKMYFFSFSFPLRVFVFIKFSILERAYISVAVSSGQQYNLGFSGLRDGLENVLRGHT